MRASLFDSPQISGAVQYIDARGPAELLTLKAARAGVVTGALLAVARIAGETAPLLFTALNSRFYNYFLDQPMSSLTVQIFNYATGPFEVEHSLAWAATLVLVTLILVINIAVRYLTRKRF